MGLGGGGRGVGVLKEVLYEEAQAEHPLLVCLCGVLWLKLET